MAILGHVTEKQAIHYIMQASQRGLADDGMANWEKADDAVIDNVTRTRIERKRIVTGKQYWKTMS